MYIFRGRGVFIDVYKADNKIASSGATSLADIDLRRTYRAIDSVATGRIPSLSCGLKQLKNVDWFAPNPCFANTIPQNGLYLSL